MHHSLVRSDRCVASPKNEIALQKKMRVFPRRLFRLSTSWYRLQTVLEIIPDAADSAYHASFFATKAKNRSRLATESRLKKNERIQLSESCRSQSQWSSLLMLLIGSVCVNLCLSVRGCWPNTPTLCNVCFFYWSVVFFELATANTNSFVSWVQFPDRLSTMRSLVIPVSLLMSHIHLAAFLLRPWVIFSLENSRNISHRSSNLSFYLMLGSDVFQPSPPPK